MSDRRDTHEEAVERRRAREGREAVRDEREARPRRPTHSLTAAAAGGAGLRHIIELTNREAEGVTLVKPAEHGWVVDVEVVEDRRIPSSGDVLAIYEAELDEEGELVSYRRLRRYRRGSGDSDGYGR
ncbi:gas vesicle protein GvpO [Sinosporangium siamense]|uniref:Gas vesicle synthesis protein GvpO n=1 Tax=Sinosporangium siamense TaxID=1367973 RepID=A0A919RFQ1_9ACTN|nr:gas vesicle protein GvpO [Sinosporangium siamense]GII92872.1 hypothetical protein Ssi02_31030 [Sinosporangium siamense]